MTREELTKRYQMQPHVEGGLYRELYREETPASERAASGVIYYAIGKGEYSEFHSLDCDEYWLHHSGCTLEIWIYDAQGALSIHQLGQTDGAQPCLLLKAGVLFAARPIGESDDPAFLSCVTVPQFSYEHYRLLTKEEMLGLHPNAKAFYEGL